ncbi:MAG: diol dehydratase small subunit [Rhizobiaceae bacterium]
MDNNRLGAKDYPLAENRPDLVLGQRGKQLGELDLAAVERGDVVMDDFRITSQALEMQADIARDCNRPKLGDNFNRASELTNIPQDYLMEIYEFLRPGRAKDKSVLLEISEKLRTTYQAERMAEFIEEAAEVYEQRGLFTTRY